MPLNITGGLSPEPKIKVGFIGCGSHAFRNIYPTFQFAPVQLIATCDLNAEKAAAYAKQFGADRSYSNHHEMLKKEDLDAVFIVTNYDEEGRPRYPALAADCLKAGCHVWTEKPAAATSDDLAKLRGLVGDLNFMVGLKKMFFPANEKAKELMESPDFGTASLVQLQYPMPIPTVDEFSRYLNGRENLKSVIGFLDHLCHPVSLLLFLSGMPKTLYYDRATSGAGVAMFKYADGRLATISLTHGSAGPLERTVITSDRWRQIVVENNIRLTYHRNPPGDGYGSTTNHFKGTPDQTSAIWEPEFSLGQLYNKGLFLLGYYNEVLEFASSILQKRKLAKGHLEHAWQATRIFEAFAEGPGKAITL